MKVGLIAGWGRYPVVIAEALRAQGYDTYCVGVKDHADPRLAQMCDDFKWVGLGQLGKAIRFLRRRGVKQATLAGKVHKVVFYQRGVWLRHRPDLRWLRTFYPHFIGTRMDRKDDTLLLALVNAFKQDGIQLGPATDYAPLLLVEAGCLTKRAPTSAQMKDIQFGWQLAKEMGRLDVGQTVAVKDRAALAIEAIEGTDECIRRAGTLCGTGGFTIVKVAKPQQDMRFDVPTVGLGTLEAMVAAGGKVLAIEAARTIVIDQPKVVAFANQHKLIVTALNDPQGSLTKSAGDPQASLPTSFGEPQASVAGPSVPSPLAWASATTTKPAQPL